MKDFLGNTLEVGDDIVCIELKYYNLKRAKIIKITPKTLLVEYTKWGKPTQVKRYADQVVKI